MAERKSSERKRPAIRVRRARLTDVPGLYACQVAAYGGEELADLCDERLIRMQIETFPAGQLVAVQGKEVVGYAA